MTGSNSRGFSLIELMVSVAILATAIIFATIVTGTIKTVRDATYESVASAVADTKLAELRAGGYAALPASGSFTSALLSSLPQGTASTTVTVWNAKTKKVDVGVSWLGAASTTKYVLYSTLVTESGGL